jgi:hypothetical protein
MRSDFRKNIYPDLFTNNSKNIPSPMREGIEGRGYLLAITLSPTLSRPGRGDFLFFIS